MGILIPAGSLLPYAYLGSYRTGRLYLPPTHRPPSHEKDPVILLILGMTTVAKEDKQGRRDEVLKEGMGT